MEEIHRGAEAVIYKEDDKIVKKRLKKSYRLDLLDNKIRSQRTKSESNILQTLKAKGIPGPQLLETDEEETIEMEFLEGEMLAEALDKENAEEVMERAGEVIADLHSAGLIHGDLTTSNMILHEKEVHLIDFGLSYHSQKTEDRAVDIHLLKEALEAKHHNILEKSYESFKKGYKNFEGYEDVMQRLKEVEGRGRYKGK